MNDTDYYKSLARFAKKLDAAAPLLAASITAIFNQYAEKIEKEAGISIPRVHFQVDTVDTESEGVFIAADTAFEAHGFDGIQLYIDHSDHTGDLCFITKDPEATHGERYEFLGRFKINNVGPERASFNAASFPADRLRDMLLGQRSGVISTAGAARLVSPPRPTA